jgi:hypothetical protein
MSSAFTSRERWVMHTVLRDQSMVCNSTSAQGCWHADMHFVDQQQRTVRRIIAIALCCDSASTWLELFGLESYT